MKREESSFDVASTITSQNWRREKMSTLGNIDSITERLIRNRISRMPFNFIRRNFDTYD